MRLNQLKFLVELNKYKTISETAQKLYISQPSLSTAIKELEEELGFAIIERSNKGVKFTKRGEIVLKYSRDVMQAVNSIERLGRKHEQAPKGYLSIASVYYVFQSVVMDAFFAFKEQYPNAATTLQEDDSYSIVQKMIKKEIDLGVIMISNLEEMNTQHIFEQYNLMFSPMIDEHMYFVVGPNNPLYGKTSATMQELLQFPFLTRRNMMNQFNENMLRRYNKNLDIIQIDEGDSFFKYLYKSQAVSVMPGCAVRQAMQDSNIELHIIRAKDFNWTSKIGWISPKNTQFSAEEEAFINLLEEKSVEYNNKEK